MRRPPPTEAEPASVTKTARPAVRLALLYAAYFAVLGVLVPFWPVWLRSRGMDAAETGALVAAGVWIRVLSGPLVGRAADASGSRKGTLLAAAWAALAAFACFSLAHGFAGLMVVSLAFGWFFTSIPPLVDSLTVLALGRHGGGYGRVRLWGSLAFLGAATATGFTLERTDPAGLWGVALALLLVHALACAAAPEHHTEPARARALRKARVWRVPGLYLVVAGASLVQGSHAIYYGFSTLHWRESGLSTTLIGTLWAIGVSAEVALFSWRGALVRLGPPRLLLAGALGGAVRWSVTGATTDPAVLVGLQTMHALTFAATHLGAVAYLSRALPAELASSAQALYSGIGSGVALGAALSVAGLLYAMLGGAAYWAMAALASLGGVAMTWGFARAARARCAIRARPE